MLTIRLVQKLFLKGWKKVIPHLIHLNQSYFIEDRYIGDTIRTLLDVMAYTDQFNDEGLLTMMIDDRLWKCVWLGRMEIYVSSTQEIQFWSNANKMGKNVLYRKLFYK